jgi:hypothetical protein
MYPTIICSVIMALVVVKADDNVGNVGYNIYKCHDDSSAARIMLAAV